MKLFILLIVVILFVCSSAKFQFHAINSIIPKIRTPFDDLTLPDFFDPLDVTKFVGFNASSFDGKIFNPFNFSDENIFTRYIKRYNRNYSEAEKPLRRSNLLKSIRTIAEHIIKSMTVGTTFDMGLTSLSDYSDEEYMALLGIPSNSNFTQNFKQRSKRAASSGSICKAKYDKSILQNYKSYDLRTYGYVTPVKNQMSCGSCWAFSAIAAIESQYAMKGRKNLDLSEQDLVCNVICPGYGGCKGAFIENAYDFVKGSGTQLETSDPYRYTDTQCKKTRVLSTFGISDYCKQYSRTDEEIMLDVLSFGAVIVYIDASYINNFKQYKARVIDVKECINSKKHNHAVNIVGWGTEEGIDYWIIKNSWSTGWGIDGYLRMARKKNMCGINEFYFYPIVK